MNPKLRAVICEGDVFAVSDNYLVRLSVSDKEIVVEVLSQNDGSDVAEMTLEIPYETHRIGFTPGVGSLRSETVPPIP